MDFFYENLATQSGLANTRNNNNKQFTYLPEYILDNISSLLIFIIEANYVVCEIWAGTE